MKDSNTGISDGTRSKSNDDNNSDKNFKVHTSSDLKKGTKQVQQGEDVFSEDEESQSFLHNHYSTANFRKYGVPWNSFSMEPSDWIDFFSKWKWSPAPFFGPYGMHLSLSVALNGVLCLLFLLILLPDRRAYHHMRNKTRDWTLPSVFSAKQAYKEKCSGRGDIWVDTVSNVGAKVCECHPCFTGTDCSQTIKNCVIDAKRGDALLFEHYWKVNRATSSVLIPGHYRIGYGENSVDDISATQNLERLIQTLHEKVGNANLSDKHIVIGAGSTQLIAASLFAFGHTHSEGASGVPLVVTAEAPFSQVFKESTTFYDSRFFGWGGLETGWLVRKAPKTLEFVTSPSNPDGHMRKANLTGEHAFAIYDHTYYWPHYTPITGAADNEVMIFSLSKLTGHAGSRIGWAIVKDRKIADSMNKAIQTMTLGVARESQLRTAQILSSIVEGIAQNRGAVLSKPSSLNTISPEQFAEDGLLFPHVATLMTARWERLQSVFNGNPRFTLQDRTASHCTFFNATRTATPAYAWVKCNGDADCFKVFKGFGVEGHSGTIYSAGKDYVRLSLLMRQSTFDLLLKQLASNL